MARWTPPAPLRGEPAGCEAWRFGTAEWVPGTDDARTAAPGSTPPARQTTTGDARGNPPSRGGKADAGPTCRRGSYRGETRPSRD
jgi:hypothetical protein